MTYEVWETGNDLDIADIIWWIKGNNSAEGDNFSNAHIETLKKVRRLLKPNKQQEVNK